MTDREKFEAWAKEYSFRSEYDFYRGEDGDYMNWEVRDEWKVWQASRKQMAEEAAAVCAELLELSKRQALAGDPFEIGREGGHRECLDAIRSLATPTEGKT